MVKMEVLGIGRGIANIYYPISNIFSTAISSQA